MAKDNSKENRSSSLNRENPSSNSEMTQEELEATMRYKNMFPNAYIVGSAVFPKQNGCLYIPGYWVPPPAIIQKKPKPETYQRNVNLYKPYQWTPAYPINGTIQVIRPYFTLNRNQSVHYPHLQPLPLQIPNGLVICSTYVPSYIPFNTLIEYPQCNYNTYHKPLPNETARENIPSNQCVSQPIIQESVNATQHLNDLSLVENIPESSKLCTDEQSNNIEDYTAVAHPTHVKQILIESQQDLEATKEPKNKVAAKTNSEPDASPTNLKFPLLESNCQISATVLTDQSHSVNQENDMTDADLQMTQEDLLQNDALLFESSNNMGKTPDLNRSNEEKIFNTYAENFALSVEQKQIQELLTRKESAFLGFYFPKAENNQLYYNGSEEAIDTGPILNHSGQIQNTDGFIGDYFVGSSNDASNLYQNGMLDILTPREQIGDVPFFGLSDSFKTGREIPQVDNDVPLLLNDFLFPIDDINNFDFSTYREFLEYQNYEESLSNHCTNNLEQILIDREQEEIKLRNNLKQEIGFLDNQLEVAAANCEPQLEMELDVKKFEHETQVSERVCEEQQTDTKKSKKKCCKKLNL